LFNRTDTWEHLVARLIEVSEEALAAGAVGDALAERAVHHPLYSAAYIMPPPQKRAGPKFRRHLELLQEMISGALPERLATAPTMAHAFNLLASYDSIGPFLAFQFLTDLNYTSHLRFSECEFVVAGPGALRGLRKCIADPGDYGPADVIRWVMDQQEQAFADRELDWIDLWGRPLQLIDVQNLFCEVDKYTRAANPEFAALVPGVRIKQRYRPERAPLTARFPPKWGIHAGCEGSADPGVGNQLPLFAGT
jgi:hypothetical protein